MLIRWSTASDGCCSYSGWLVPASFVAAFGTLEVSVLSVGLTCENRQPEVALSAAGRERRVQELHPPQEADEEGG